MMLKFIIPADCGFSAGIVALGRRRAESTDFLIAFPPGERDLKFGLALAGDDPKIAFAGQRRAELHFHLLGAMGHPANRLLHSGGDIGGRNGIAVLVDKFSNVVLARNAGVHVATAADFSKDSR